VVSAAAPSRLRRGKWTLAAGRGRTGCQQNAKPENILKTKDGKQGFSLAKPENKLKISQLA
jgi:hypothetical protein